MKNTTKKIVLRYEPHQKQKQVHSSVKRFKIATCGRRFGKSLLAAGDILNRVFSGKYDKHDDIAWIAPSFQVSDRGVDAIRLITKECPEIVTWYNSYPKTATFINGVKVRFLSASNPDSLRGFGFSHIVIDEGDYIDDYTWTDVIRPALADKMGTMIAISTPKRKHSWFHKLYLRGLDDDKEIDSFHFPSSCNPYLPKSEIEEARLSLPETTFLREWLAEWTESGGEVFQNIDACIEESDCTCNASEIIGVDLAKHQDYTVIMRLCSKCKTVKEIIRFNSINWNEQKKRIKNVYINAIVPIIYVDATGVGDVVYDDLVQEGLRVKPFKFTNTSKQHLINNLRLHIMQGAIKWSPKLKEAHILRHELECYEVQSTKTGKITYNAPLGMHDDCVIALGLACEGLESFIKPKVGVEEEESKEVTTVSMTGWTTDIQDGQDGYDFGDSNSTFFGG